jgi:hypothetical protein
MKSAYKRTLHRVRLVCSINELLADLSLCLAGVGALSAACVAVDRAFSLQIFMPWMIGVAVGLAGLLAIAGWIFRQPGMLATACLIDDKLHLRERFSTAYALANSDEPFAVAARDEAHRQAELLNVKGKFTIRFTRRWALTAIAWLAAGAAILFLPQMDLLGCLGQRQEQSRQNQELQQAQDQIKQAAQQVGIAIKPLEDAGLAGDLAKLDQADGAIKADDMKRQAIKRLDELAGKLEQSKQSSRLQSASELKDMLKTLRPSPQGLVNDLNRSLAMGDFKKAGAMANDLRRQLEEGKLSKDQKAALANQMKDLAAQLEKAAKEDKEFEKSLQDAGLDKKLAEMKEDELRKALENSGLSKEKIEELLAKAAACRNASQACNKLSQALASSGLGENDDQMAEAMDDLSEQLSQSEALQAEMDAVQAGLNCIGQACRGLGQRPGGSGTGEFEEGLADSFGYGTGGPGVSAGGPRDSDDSGEFSLDKTKADTKVGKGPSIASSYFKGQQVKGESRKELTTVVQAAKDAAAEAISDNQIPRKYEGPVKKYFGALEQSGTSK